MPSTLSWPDPDLLTARAACFKDAYGAALRETRPSDAQLAWRLGRFDRGIKLMGELARRVGPLDGKHLLDLGAAHGGDACAAASLGMHVTLIDQIDHDYDNLRSHLRPLAVLQTQVCDLNAPAGWPLAPARFDVVMAMAVVDHIHDLRRFFDQVARALKPGGVAVVDTPTALRGVHRDGHYGLPGLSLLPMRAKRFVAERLFARRYRSQLANRIYYTAGPLLRAAAAAGLAGRPHKYADSPLMRRLSRWPAGRAWQAVARHTVFDYCLLFKPTSAQRRAVVPGGASGESRGQMSASTPTAAS